MAFATPPEAVTGFHAVLAGLSAAERVRVEAVGPAAAAEAAIAARHWEFILPARVVDAALGAPPGPELDRLRRGLAAIWALEFPQRVSALSLPGEVQAMMPVAAVRLSTFLQTADGPYDLDDWAKDLRFVLGLTVPCGAQVVDLHARIGAGEVLRHVLAGKPSGAALSYVAAGGWGAWAQVHTERRDLADFNPEGWDACYRRVAALLKSRPQLRGMIGSSWFYDPPLRSISPRLAYLQERPLANGAFLIHQGTGDLYTARATETSPTRRGLVESGVYTPRSWILAWPRARMIRWADTQAA